MAIVQLVHNPGFEHGLDGWALSGTVLHVSSPTRTGSGAARLSGSSASITQHGIAIPTNATSVIPRFAYRAMNAISSSLRMTIHDAAGGAELYASNSLSVWAEEANTWKYYDEQLRAADIARATRGKTVMVRVTATNVTLFVGDITLTTNGTLAPGTGDSGKSTIHMPMIMRNAPAPLTSSTSESTTGGLSYPRRPAEHSSSPARLRLALMDLCGSALSIG